MAARGMRPGPGELLFRWRSYLPLVAVAILLVGLWWGLGTAPEGARIMATAGVVLAGLGLCVRLYAVGHAPAGTSGRHRLQHAERLNTFGIYSVLRHPLYLGNLFVWVGVSLTSGWPAGAGASALAGVVAFALIARHEDDYLARRFGTVFREWAEATPAFLPRPGLWRTARHPFRWAKAVSSEYSTLHSIVLLTLLFTGVRRWAGTGVWPGAGWWTLLGANSALYLGLRIWRGRRKGAEKESASAPAR